MDSRLTISRKNLYLVTPRGVDFETAKGGVKLTNMSIETQVGGSRRGVGGVGGMEGEGKERGVF